MNATPPPPSGPLSSPSLLHPLFLISILAAAHQRFIHMLGARQWVHGIPLCRLGPKPYTACTLLPIYIRYIYIYIYKYMRKYECGWEKRNKWSEDFAGSIELVCILLSRGNKVLFTWFLGSLGWYIQWLMGSVNGSWCVPSQSNFVWNSIALWREVNNFIIGKQISDVKYAVRDGARREIFH